MRKEYREPEIEVILLQEKDIITASPTPYEEGDENGD